MRKIKTIAVGGFQHETNTFAPERADFAAFLEPGGWPALARGEAMSAAVAGMNLPVTGFLDEMTGTKNRIAPLAWAAATPSAHVTADAFERISGMLLDGLEATRSAGGLDGVYLDLHGAMVTENHQDGEGELLRRVRARVGTAVPIVASLDLHANVTPAMVEHADALVAYRTYPHIDMATTGRRAARLMQTLLSGVRPAKAYRQGEYLIPLVWQSDLAEPCATLYRGLGVLEQEDSSILSASLTMGFPPADIHDAGPAVICYAENQRAAERAADSLAERLARAEAQFAGRIFAPEEAVDYAASRPGWPIVIADSQDNPGAGGNSDTTGMLRALVERGPERSVIGLIYDPNAARRAHEAGSGNRVRMALGAVSPWRGDQPLEAEYEVVAVSAGAFTATGPMFAGARMQLGPMARLRLNGVDILVTSRKMQAADQSMFRNLGIEPAEMKILVLKSSVHFRADFQPIAKEIIIAAAPGPNPVDHHELPYTNLRDRVRLMPRVS